MIFPWQATICSQMEWKHKSTLWSTYTYTAVLQMGADTVQCGHNLKYIGWNPRFHGKGLIWGTEHSLNVSFLNTHRKYFHSLYMSLEIILKAAWKLSSTKTIVLGPTTKKNITHLIFLQFQFFIKNSLHTIFSKKINLPQNQNQEFWANGRQKGIFSLIFG